jgi:hypothetical protein
MTPLYGRRHDGTILPGANRAGLLDMMNQLYHRSSAIFEIISACLRFLEMHRLIDAEECTQTLNHLAPLAEGEL